MAIDLKAQSLCHFRNLVYCLYREIRVLRTSNHREVACKAKLSSPYFTRSSEGLRQAKELYYRTEIEEDTRLILRPYEERTGLSLEDLHRAFEEGDWLLGRTWYSYGGPKWAKIAKTTLDLRRAIDLGDWEAAARLIPMVVTLRHNTDWVICKYRRRCPPMSAYQECQEIQ